MSYNISNYLQPVHYYEKVLPDTTSIYQKIAHFHKSVSLDGDNQIYLPDSIGDWEWNSFTIIDCSSWCEVKNCNRIQINPDSEVSVHIKLCTPYNLNFGIYQTEMIKMKVCSFSIKKPGTKNWKHEACLVGELMNPTKYTNTVSDIFVDEFSLRASYSIIKKILQ
jgi:hypothetical protein